MGEEGRVYLSAADLSPFIHRSKCSWCSSGFGLGAVSFCGKRLQAALPEWLPELRERIRRARFTA